MKKFQNTFKFLVVVVFLGGCAYKNNFSNCYDTYMFVFDKENGKCKSIIDTYKEINNISHIHKLDSDGNIIKTQDTISIEEYHKLNTQAQYQLNNRQKSISLITESSRINPMLTKTKYFKTLVLPFKSGDKLFSQITFFTTQKGDWSVQ